jgi:septum site-determining protein MinD
MGKIVGVISLKGGVGKTSVVASLGEAVSGFGKKVLLIDGNLSAPNLGMHLKIIDPERTLHDVLDNKIQIKDSIYSYGNIDVIPSSIFGDDKINPLKLKEKIRPLKKDYDLIIIDSSPSLNEETFGVMIASDSLLVVTTPDFPTMSMTLKAVKIARQRGTPIDGLVINKVHNKNFELSLEDIESTSEIPVMAVIPHDVKVLKALSEFTPYTKYELKSEGTTEFKKLAAALIGQKYRTPRLHRFLRWVIPKKQEINRTLYYQRVFNQ